LSAGDRGGAAARGTGSVTVEFGRLFEHYVTISNKLVGVLLRARRQGLVHFDGEMLWQGQDDRVVITLRQ
uniref:Costars domain-containing protein n=1 Tax=Gadus morhua TaxID=8049 RepID=A0A8C5AP14_GADMO